MTDVIVYKANDDTQSLIYFDGLNCDGDNARVDSLRIHLLHWSNGNVLVENPGVVLAAPWVGQIFDSIEAARSALVQFNTVTDPKDGIPCLSDLKIHRTETTISKECLCVNASINTRCCASSDAANNPCGHIISYPLRKRLRIRVGSVQGQPPRACGHSL